MSVKARVSVTDEHGQGGAKPAQDPHSVSGADRASWPPMMEVDEIDDAAPAGFETREPLTVPARHDAG